MKFLLTQELGKLAKWLRILGFDTAYVKSTNLSSLVIQALQEERLIVTRNHHLLESRGLKIVLLRGENLKDQLGQLIEKLNLRPDIKLMFSRCTLCNIKLKPIQKEKILGRIPEYVFATQDKFFICEKCKRIYWQGSHWGNAAQLLKEIGLALEN